jgi:hypothetical protein
MILIFDMGIQVVDKQQKGRFIFRCIIVSSHKNFHLYWIRIGSTYHTIRLKTMETETYLVHMDISNFVF